WHYASLLVTHPAAISPCPKNDQAGNSHRCGAGQRHRLSLGFGGDLAALQDKGAVGEDAGRAAERLQGRGEGQVGAAQRKGNGGEDGAPAAGTKSGLWRVWGADGQLVVEVDLIAADDGREVCNGVGAG